MITRLYSIRDSKTGIYHKPWYSLNNEDAERGFKTVVNNPKSENIHDFPEDFDLFFLGTYDDNTGLVTPEPTPIHVQKAIHLKMV